MRGYFPTNVSDFTKEQCEEYLASYPNSLKAEIVRERLNLLSPKQKTNTLYGDDEYWDHHHSSVGELKSYQLKYPNGKHIGECRNLLEQLTIRSKEHSQQSESISDSDANSSNKKTHAVRNTPNGDTKAAEGTKIWEVIVAIIVVIVVFILSMLMWDWIKETFPVLAGIMCIVFVIKNIFFKD